MLSVIIPALNEAATLPATLAALPPQDRRWELILVDGGSQDDTESLARGAGIRVLTANRGRARQMNAGAALAKGDNLLFLHADTRLPHQALPAVARALEQHHWGRFDLSIRGRHPLLRVIAFFINLRSRLSGIATGDQAIFVRRESFERIGGFPDQPLMEDIELSKRLKRLSAPACLRLRACTSGRRWEERGLLRTIWLMWRLRFAYWRGTDAEALARAYR
ncbi:TIGR04283 family arsenosugar biosynthesis glycosyltransferase [Zobellella sp. DQSA1]|uniref:TIGR04283 family arsenosugar biosynthesis glycosyltransferase n=1 Tax=Zobellella sp. DQSA1 TaxID=3342386 RepID=UPI0035BEEEA5